VIDGVSIQSNWGAVVDIVLDFLKTHYSSVLATISAVFAILAVIQTYRAHQFNKRITAAEGTFKKAELSVDVYGQKDLSKFIFAIPLRNHVWEIPIIISLSNIGEKTQEDIEVYIRASKWLLFGPETKYRIKKGGPKNLKMNEPESSDAFLTKTITMNNIHPKQKVSLPLPASFVFATLKPIQVDATTRDGVDVRVNTWMEVILPMDIVIAQKNAPPISKRIEVVVVDVSKIPIKDFFEQYNAALTRRYLEQRESWTLAAAFRNCFVAPEKSTEVAVISIKEDTTNIMPNNKGVSLITVSPNKLSLHQGIALKSKYFIPSLNIW
jgi:hypothetical protein